LQPVTSSGELAIITFRHLALINEGKGQVR